MSHTIRSTRLHQHRSFTGAGIVGAGALLLGVLLAACSSGPAGLGVANVNSKTPTTAPSQGNSSFSSQGGAGGGGGGANPPPVHSQIAQNGVTVALAQCMRAHGMPNFPDPNSQGVVQLNGVDPQSPQFQSAQKACAKYEPNGGKPPSPAQQAKLLANALKFSECMRSHGVTNFPDPTTKDGGISIRIRAGSGSHLDPMDPVFQAAQKACGSPGGPGGPFAKAPAPAAAP
jgi:hypothetical protein